MKRLAAALLAATVMMPVPVLSQDTPPPLKDCWDLLDFARGELVSTPETIVEDIPGGCRFFHVGFFLDASVVVDVDEIIMLGPDLLATYPKNEVLLSSDLTLKGLASPEGSKIDLQLVYTSDPEERTSALERLSIDAGDLGRFTVSGRLSEFDNANVEAPLSELSGVINEVTFALEDNGIVAAHLLPILSGALAVLDDGRTAPLATILSLPQDLISKKSAAAVVRFINALPNPHGHWTLSFQSDEGLPISALSAPSFYEMAAQLPNDTRIRATAELL